MKFSPFVSSSRRKNRKAHFGADSNRRQKLMSSPLSKELQQQHKVRAMPVRKDDEVVIARGKFKLVEGKVVSCFRKKFVLHIEGAKITKQNEQPVFVGIHPSNVIIKRLKMDKDRKATLERKARGAQKKVSSGDISQMD
ncbi:60S ribosomal protein L26 [Hondaea fermentalgiana]|uniref:60S ribosomal protein L26 n=1 Tax=Hondaea fermentalgiana TaxID=2315210 RepID=A0A2R5GPF2_9STRA|nr:60S ribosomal protein L26 [Hondaea fermentalgiana]|eukprot:GBG32747.1 60S ribosomal protein L26 [Hondaea fermentalgiana]